MIERRLFLRSLASLPLIGGSVALIGSPTQAAVPVTDALLRRYVTFTAMEHRAALVEWFERQGEPSHAKCPPMYWVPDCDVELRWLMHDAKPSTRAAVILSAAGVSLTGGQARG